MTPIVSSKLCQCSLFSTGLASGFVVGYIAGRMQEEHSTEILLQYTTGMLLCVAGGRLGIYRLQRIFETQIGGLINSSSISNMVIGQPTLLDLPPSSSQPALLELSTASNV